MDFIAKIKQLPLTPGVYLMKDKLGHVIYVGKAKQLKRRVSSYFQHSRNHPPKVKLMVRHIRDVEVIHTDTEFEAFLLECQLIKQLKPMYNKKMKNPQAYTYIALRTDNGRRLLELTYQPEPQRDELLLGPYTSRSTVERALHGMQEALGILCSQPHTARATPCLNHSLGLCNGMCAGGQALEDYHRLIDRMTALLQGHEDTGILAAMEERMVMAAERSDYETAARFRDELQAVQALLYKEKVIDFAAHYARLAVLEPIDSETLKLILLSGGLVVRERRLLLDADNGPDGLLTEMYREIAVAFGGETAPAAVKPVGRDEIDEAQIIYSHLQKATCSYLAITDEWLTHREAAAEALAGLLEACPAIDE